MIAIAISVEKLSNPVGEEYQNLIRAFKKRQSSEIENEKRRQKRKLEREERNKGDDRSKGCDEATDDK